MRRNISESKLNRIISESIEYTVLRNQVRQIVSEEVSRYVSSFINEEQKTKKTSTSKNKDPEGNAQTFRDIYQYGAHADKYNGGDFAREVLGKYYKGNDDTLRSLASKMARGEREIPSEIAADAMAWVRAK